VLGCYLLGRPCFARTFAMEQAGRAVGFTSEDVKAFNTLYLFRLHVDGRCGEPFKPSWDHVMEFYCQMEIILQRLEEVADAFEGRLPEPNCESQVRCFGAGAPCGNVSKGSPAGRRAKAYSAHQEVTVYRHRFA
jgi:hypothetical protein